MICITRREIQAQETRKRIFDAAIALYDSKGFTKTSISDIAERANVSVGSFYEYFDCKEDLLQEYMFALGSDFHEIYMRIKNGQEGSFSDHMEQIRFFLRTCLLTLTHNSQYKYFVRISFSYVICSSSVFANHDRPFFHILSELIALAKEEGSIRTDLSSEFILHQILFLYRSVAFEWCSNEKDIPIEAYFPELDALIHFLRNQEVASLG